MRLSDLWEDYPVYADGEDSVTVEVYEPWLQDGQDGKDKEDENVVRDFPESKVVDHGDHVHDARYNQGYNQGLLLTHQNIQTL